MDSVVHTGTMITAEDNLILRTHAQPFFSFELLSTLVTDKLNFHLTEKKFN